METLKQIRLAAVRNVARRAARRRELIDSDKRWELNENIRNQKKHQAVYVKNERKNRREDWEAGPRLAPRRDVGALAVKYGTVDQSTLSPIAKSGRDQKRVKTWLAEADRVVVLEGRDKGKIGTVSDVDEPSQTVKVKGMNQVDFLVPEYMRQQGNDPRPIATFTANIPWTCVKLVHAVPDEAGSFRDVIVDHVRLLRPNWKEMGKEKQKQKRGTTVKDLVRVIPGLDIEVPWPPTEEQGIPDNDSDTLRITVDELTHRPYLLHPPMPTSVINELSNVHSKFRRRPDPRKLAKMEAWQAEAERKKQLSRTMSTPMMELSEKNKAERTRKELSEEQLARIGEVMVQSGQAMPEQAA